MGVVWVARSTALDVDVALKMLKRELAGTEAVERMAREARTAAQLGHPALVRVLDFGTSDQGEPFLAMELLEGEELHLRLKREQRLPVAEAVALLLPIIDGLGTAHEKGIVHRDVKPENIFIAKDGQQRVQPKVLDFGIAKLSNERTPSRLTQVGAIMGSPYYLSPEQAEGLDDIDFRCDIWAVGVVLYELVTGTPPFAANNYNALIRSILRDEPRPITEQGVGDAQLWLVIARCLKKDREERWASMWELGEALALWLFEQGVRVDAASRSLRHGWLDGAITGVRVLVTSQAPEPDTFPPPVRPEAAEEPGLAPGQPHADSLAQTQLRPRRKRSVLPAVLLAGAVLAGVIGVVAYRYRSPGGARAVGAEVSSGVTVPHQVTPAASPQAASALRPAPAPSVDAPAAEVERPPLSTHPIASSAPTAAAPKSRSQPAPRPTSGSQRRATGGTRRHTEFGF